MSRPASCRAVYGLTPVTASVVDFWKNSGTISTRPPMATTSRISTIIRKLLVSTLSWVKPDSVAGAAFWLMVWLSLESGGGVGADHGGDVEAHRAAAGDGHPGVPGHHQHPGQVQQAAEEADDVERVGRLH